MGVPATRNRGALKAQVICMLIIKEEASKVPDWIAGVNDSIHLPPSKRVHSTFELIEGGPRTGKPISGFDIGEDQFVQIGDCWSSHARNRIELAGMALG
jgi:hypothetical protein